MALTRRIVLLSGCTGILASSFISLYSQQYQIIGVARNYPLKEPADYEFMQADIQQDVAGIVKEILQRMGTIDILINNAVYSSWKKMELADSDDMALQFQTNVIAPVELSNQVLKQCWQKFSREENLQANRCVINVSSIAAIKDYFGYGQGMYAATKAALNTVSRHMASELSAYGIRVNAVAPNTFPAYVSTEAVCETIAGMAEGTETGKIKVLDMATAYYVNE